MELARSIPTLFEAGVADYFCHFGHRQARESPHQAWLLMSVAKYVSPTLLVAELQVANQDLRPFGKLRDTNGAVNFDFAVTRSEIDLRTWKTQTTGWNRNASTAPKTLSTLQQTDVLAEFKIARSTSTTRAALIHDFRKMACALRFLNSQKSNHYPTCYSIVLDPDHRLRIDRARDVAQAEWPEFAPFPKILVGPEAG